MRIYLLVEGEKTEMRLYPIWFSYLIPELQKVDNFKSKIENSYYLFCGQGMPSIYKHTVNAIKDINTRLDYDFLIVCLDGENLNIEARKQKLYDYLLDNKVELIGNCKLRVVVQNSCIETWFLGNRKIIKINPETLEYKECLNYYNVRNYDPELMPAKHPFVIKAQYHELYLRNVFKEHGLNYSKSKPKEVLEKSYLEELQKRVEEFPTHLSSLKELFNIINEIKLGL